MTNTDADSGEGQTSRFARAAKAAAVLGGGLFLTGLAVVLLEVFTPFDPLAPIVLVLGLLVSVYASFRASGYRSGADTSVAVDDRALANGVMGFVAIIIVTAILYTLMNPAADTLFSTLSGQTANTQAQDAIDERRLIWESMLYFGLFLAALFMLARAVFESRSPG